MKVFSYEDRESDAVGIQLLALSLQRCCAGLDLQVTFPGAPDALVRWFQNRRYGSLRTDWSGGSTRNGWNIKPHVLLSALNAGEDEPLWIDSDVVLTTDFRPLLFGIDERTVVVAEDYFGAPLQGGTSRTSDWGMEVGREFPNTANSCFVRVTKAHRGLLEHWDALMQSDAYKEAQGSHWSKRPLHMMGDQDVLSALLGSREYSMLPVLWIRRGVDVAHCNQWGGYRAHEQVSNLLRRRTPVFIHGQGEKVWRPVEERSVHLELSPYTLEALKYAGEFETPPTWAEPTLPIARLLRSISPDRRAELLPALAYELRDQRVIKTLVKQILGLA